MTNPTFNSFYTTSTSNSTNIQSVPAIKQLKQQEISITNLTIRFLLTDQFLTLNSIPVDWTIARLKLEVFRKLGLIESEIERDKSRGIDHLKSCTTTSSFSTTSIESLGKRDKRLRTGSIKSRVNKVVKGLLDLKIEDRSLSTSIKNDSKPNSVYSNFSGVSFVQDRFSWKND